MTTLVQAALSFRRGARAAYGYVTALVFALLTLLGSFGARGEPGVEHAVLGGVWSAVLVTRVVVRVRDERRGGQPFFDLELGLLLLAGAHAALQIFGGLTSPLYPGLYVLVAFMSSVAPRPVGRALVLLAVGFEAGVYFLTEAHSDPKPFLLHAVFLLLFGLLNLIFTQAEISRGRMLNQRELRDEQEKAREDARVFRLVATPTADAVSDEDRLMRSSVDEVHQGLYFNLDLMKRTLGLHTCVLLLADETGSELRVAECVSDQDIESGPFKPGSGAVGAAYQRGIVMNLEQLRPGYDGICYYGGATDARAFIAVPVREGNEVRGVLCADRLEARPFCAADEQMLSDAVAHLLRTLENEQVFLQLERSKREHAVLYRASATLGAAVDEPAVLDEALSAAAEIAPFDFAAITHYDPDSRVHRVRRAVGAGAEQLADLSFRDNTSLTAMAVKNRHYLPYRGEFDAASQLVYTRKANLSGMQSLLIMPLLVREVAIGTFALAARRPEAFGPRVRPALSALANNVAVALSNAASVKQLEQLATTDGLTGCFNKRYFNEQLQAKLNAAERFGRKLSLVITDIDHFKGVNDTYGHATGDVVIRELGAILQRLKRETDVVARFGGEEFCLLCEETDAEGAQQLAERVRQELQHTVFETELGKLEVTCSLGVATYPDHAAQQHALFEAADRALYVSKHGGRNQVSVC